MDIDKPLDEIIAAKPKTRRGRGPARGAGAAGGRAAPAAGGAGNNARARYAGNAPRASGPAAAAAQKPIAGEATKIIISNLPGDVTEAAVRDLMQSTVGPVKSVQMSYNAQGKTTGSATVLFRNKGDAHKAHASYNNRMIDNQRPMKVEIAVDPATLVSLASRVGPAPQAARGAAGNTAPRRGGRGGAAGKPRAPRPKPKTADELDADMDSWKEKPAA